ncbi:MAG: histidinol-phosphate transaminase [Solirubrobacterales bacterium]|nr:histidinol-phosphate transaminase [Solirubrobacterales bacterium]
MPIEFAARLRRMPVYPLAAGYDLGADVAMMASNECCFAPLPEVVEAARRTLGGAHRYPDPSYFPLRRALADRYGIPPGRIALGNGSCDILLAAGQALLEPGAELVYAWPAFSVYRQLAAASEARAIEVPLDDEDRHDLDAMATEVTVATRLLLICNPNNPTSTAVSLEEVEGLLRRVPSHVCVILDEAYCEFALTLGDTYASLDLLRKYPNLVLLRTFSKVYGLASLRAGYALGGAEDFRVAVDQVRQPFYLNAAAQAAAVEALRHQDEVERRVTEAIASRLDLEDRLRALGLWVARSDANFIWLHLPEEVEEADVVAALLERGVLVRAGTALGREGALRVTVGTDDENARFAEALEASLASLTASGTKRGR